MGTGITTVEFTLLLMAGLEGPEVVDLVISNHPMEDIEKFFINLKVN